MISTSPTTLLASAFTAGLLYAAFPSVHLKHLPHLPQESAFAVAQLTSIYQWARLSGLSASSPSRSSCAHLPLRCHRASARRSCGCPRHRGHYIDVWVIKIAGSSSRYSMHRSVPLSPFALFANSQKGAWLLETSLSSTRCLAKLPMPVTRPMYSQSTVLSGL